MRLTVLKSLAFHNQDYWLIPNINHPEQMADTYIIIGRRSWAQIPTT